MSSIARGSAPAKSPWARRCAAFPADARISTAGGDRVWYLNFGSTQYEAALANTQMPAGYTPLIGNFAIAGTSRTGPDIFWYKAASAPAYPFSL